MPVPYIFATQPASQALPLAYLDANFAYLDKQFNPYIGNFTVQGEIASILNAAGSCLQLANYATQYGVYLSAYNQAGLLTYIQGQIDQGTSPAFSMAMRQNVPFLIRSWDNVNSQEVEAFRIITHLGSPSTAYIGINNASPAYPLDVVGSIKSSANVYSSQLVLNGSTSGAVTIKGAAAAGTWTMTLPDNDGASGQYLQTDGSGNLSWANSTVSAGGSNTSVQFNNLGALDGDTSFVYDSTLKKITLNGTAGNQVTISQGVSGWTSNDIGPLIYLNNTNASTSYHGWMDFIVNGSSKTDIHYDDTTSSFVIDTALNNWMFGNASPAAAHYLISNSTSVSMPRGNLIIGAGATATGKVQLYNSTNNNYVVVQSGTNSGSWALTLPTSSGTSGYVLTTDGSGATSWAAPGASSTVTVPNGGTGSTSFTVNPSSNQKYLIYGNGTSALSSSQNLYYDTSTFSFSAYGAAINSAWTQPGVCFNIANTASTFANFISFYGKTTSSASFTGVITPNVNGTGTLTVSSVTGTISPNQYLAGAGVLNGTVILSGAGSTWIVNLSQSVSSTAMSSVAPRLVGTIANTNAAGSGDGFYTRVNPNIPYAIEVAEGSSPKEALNIDSSANVYIENGPLWQYTPAPTAVSGAVTLTAAQVRVGIISATGTSYTVTLPTGANLDTLFSAVPTTDIGFNFSVVNAASGTVTIAVGASGMTSVGTLTVATGASAIFRLRRTAANTYILYRIS